VQNADTETSHYAATAIMEKNRKLLNEVQKLGEIVKSGNFSDHVLTDYASALKEYLRSGMVSLKQRKPYLDTQSRILGLLLESGTKVSQAIDKMNCDIEREDYPEAQAVCRKLLNSHPDDEAAYLM